MRIVLIPGQGRYGGRNGLVAFTQHQLKSVSTGPNLAFAYAAHPPASLQAELPTRAPRAIRKP